MEEIEMEIEFIKTKKREKNPNQMDFKLKNSVVLNIHIKDAIEESCRGIKNILCVKMIMNRKKMTGVVVTSCAGWGDKIFVDEVKDKVTEAIKSKM